MAPWVHGTGTVFGPEVSPGDAIDYRVDYIPEEGETPSRISQRAHYQHAFDQSWRLRVVGEWTRRGNDDTRYSYTRTELQWQYLEDENAGWDAAFRFDLELAADSRRADRVRLAWTANVPLNEQWDFRTNVLAAREFGHRSRDGVTLESRFEMTRELPGAGRLGVDLFNGLNSTADFGGFDEQSHRVGPVYRTRMGRLSFEAICLFGISDAAPDHDLRLILAFPF